MNIRIFFTVLGLLSALCVWSQQTERRYLSGLSLIHILSLFSRALEIAEADKIFSQQYLGGIVLHIVGMILSISKNKIFEVGDVDQKICLLYTSISLETFYPEDTDVWDTAYLHFKQVTMNH